jgi:hypothetical protein
MISFDLQFANEFPVRLAPLLRMGPVEQWQPRDRQNVEGMLDDLRELFAEWQAFKDGAY